MTFGAGGHTLALLQRCSDVTICVLDRDPTAHKLALQQSQSWYELTCENVCKNDT